MCAHDPHHGPAVNPRGPAGRPTKCVEPTVWAGRAAAVVPPLTEPGILRLLTWPVQPSDSTAATVAAAVLAVGGPLLYAARGSRTTAA